VVGPKLAERLLAAEVKYGLQATDKVINGELPAAFRKWYPTFAAANGPNPANSGSAARRCLEIGNNNGLPSIVCLASPGGGRGLVL
jgi:hypothetical protein